MNPTSMPSWLPADQRKRRWVAILLLLLLIGLIAAAVAVPAVYFHRRYDALIAELTRQVSTQTAFNAMRPRLMEKLAALKLRDVRKMYLRGTSTALALAELQETVRTTVEANGGRVISSVQGNASKEEAAYRPVTANFTVNANNANLRRVLYALETGEPYLFIDTIGITQIQTGFRPPPGAPEPEMYVQLEIRGYALRAATEGVPAAATSESRPDKGRNSDPASKGKGSAI